jgi:hypothetical protein
MVSLFGTPLWTLMSPNFPQTHTRRFYVFLSSRTKSCARIFPFVLKRLLHGECFTDPSYRASARMWRISRISLRETVTSSCPTLYKDPLWNTVFHFANALELVWNRTESVMRITYETGCSRSYLQWEAHADGGLRLGVREWSFLILLWMSLPVALYFYILCFGLYPSAVECF